LEERTLRLGHLYPRQMNVYGDRGNIICLQRRCRQREIGLEVSELGPGKGLAADEFDLFFIGGAQDHEQRLVAADLAGLKSQSLGRAVEAGTVLLAVCGGYQLAGHFYRGADGSELSGAGILDLHTVHPGPKARRLIGNLVGRWEGGELAGFENHGGRTYLGPGSAPLARVVRGYGNDGESGFEGARRLNAFGTYLHGPLLPKNPAFADRLIAIALERKYGDGSLAPLDDDLEERAHAAAVRASRRGR
jgi:CobQ-like glutamine amidotransferase family enzyme